VSKVIAPFTRWECDTCGEFILSASKGVVEWLSWPKGERQLEGNWRIVHHAGNCYTWGINKEMVPPGKSYRWLMLTDFVGSQGLSRWIGYSEHANDYEVLFDYMSRCLMPYWEQARKFWKSAFSDGVLEASSLLTVDGLYEPRFLKVVIEEYC